jgi:hypothetical protein
MKASERVIPVTTVGEVDDGSGRRQGAGDSFFRDEGNVEVFVSTLGVIVIFEFEMVSHEMYSMGDE